MNRILILLASLLVVGNVYALPPCPPDVFHLCFGAFTFDDEDKYVGEWRDGRFYGQGTYTWEDGSVYTGKWREGKMHGWGTLTLPNGDKHKGIWSKDKLVKGDVYTDAENCALRLTSNYYLPAVDACYND